MSTTPAHDWMTTKLDALLAEAKAAGISRDVAVAVLIDIVTSPDYDEAPLPGER